jgi:1-acyl-sn-glycerol-3-phosphate acyltransferase
LIDNIVAVAATAAAHLITGVRGNWQGCAPEPRPRIYFANHASHGDFILIRTALPPALRQSTRPVAAADYWLTSPARRYIAVNAFNAVLIDRNAITRTVDPVEPMTRALDEGASLILFPEGTRNTTSSLLLPFKRGIYYLAQRRPDVELVPVWIDNLNRVMPKGEFVPVPLLCTVTFGAPIHLEVGERKPDFCERARAALLALAPEHDEETIAAKEAAR